MGGVNPAAASDLLRVSKTIIEKLGIYLDFDAHLPVEFIVNSESLCTT